MVSSSNNNWHEFLPYADTVVSDIFRGELFITMSSQTQSPQQLEDGLGIIPICIYICS